MSYFPHFVMSQKGLTLWQMGHYQYEITRNSERFQLVETIMDSCEVAVKVLQELAGQR